MAYPNTPQQRTSLSWLDDENKYNTQQSVPVGQPSALALGSYGASSNDQAINAASGAFGGTGAYGNDAWKTGDNTGLGGFGTASQWETGMGAVNALGGLYGLSLQKDALKETQANNAYNRSLGTANYNMKFDAFTPEFLQAQGKAGAIGDWVGTQGGDASKYTSMANLALPTRANLG